MTSAEFRVEIGEDAARAFAQLSGDWNPLHTDSGYAAGTRFRRPILHGAYLGGLVSRMAGMHLPGTACLLHGIRLRFVAPVQPPVTVTVRGTVVSDDGDAGRTEVVIDDADTGTRYAEASYEFSRHAHADPTEAPAPASEARGHDAPPPILVTGASGSLGAAVVAALGARALPLSRTPGPGRVHAPDLERLDEAGLPDVVGGIVHCAWPAPDNQPLLASTRPREGVEHHVASPLRQMLALGRLLSERGAPGATLVLVGSTAADPGRHNYRMPLYTLAKSLVPVATRILALELAPGDRRCVAVTFDVVDGGMNEGLSARARIMNTDRSPFGRIPTPEEAAAQVAWVLSNQGFLASGATLHLTGGAIP